MNALNSSAIQMIDIDPWKDFTYVSVESAVSKTIEALHTLLQQNEETYHSISAIINQVSINGSSVSNSSVNNTLQRLNKSAKFLGGDAFRIFRRGAWYAKMPKVFKTLSPDMIEFLLIQHQEMLPAIQLWYPVSRPEVWVDPNNHEVIERIKTILKNSNFDDDTLISHKWLYRQVKPVKQHVLKQLMLMWTRESKNVQMYDFWEGKVYRFRMSAL